jgi:hypothetical protein
MPIKTFGDVEKQGSGPRRPRTQPDLKLTAKQRKAMKAEVAELVRAKDYGAALAKVLALL